MASISEVSAVEAAVGVISAVEAVVGVLVTPGAAVGDVNFTVEEGEPSFRHVSS